MSDEKIITRWFKGVFSNGEVYGIYKANFSGSTYLGEKYWRLLPNSEWVNSSRVQEWFFVGLDQIWECTEAEAFTYLPPEGLN